MIRLTLPLAAAALVVGACSAPMQVATAAPLESIPKYERSAFGDGWASTGRGCDTRDSIITRDVHPVTNADRCGPIAGTLHDPYSGLVVVGPTRQLDVDHVVALDYAWTHGAWRWSEARRVQLANDPDNLITTTAKANRSKGARGIHDWRPAVDPCGYARHLDAVADRYGLVDATRDGDVTAACR